MEVFTIAAREEVLVVRSVLVGSHGADEFKPCACPDENTGREDGAGKPLCVSQRERGKEGMRSFHTVLFSAGSRLCVALVPAMHCNNP